MRGFHPEQPSRPEKKTKALLLDCQHWNGGAHVCSASPILGTRPHSRWVDNYLLSDWSQEKTGRWWPCTFPSLPARPGVLHPSPFRAWIRVSWWWVSWRECKRNLNPVPSSFSNLPTKLTPLCNMSVIVFHFSDTWRFINVTFQSILSSWEERC